MMPHTPEQQPVPPAAPNEQGVVHIEAFVRITDPDTKEVIVEQRA
jgi:hypothetical protein